MMDKVYKLFKAWYQLWNTIYVPQILEKQKWFDTTEDLHADDIVLFKLRQSEMSIEWVLGKVELVRTGRDGLSRECVILYKSIGSTDRMITVERPIREVVKLFNIEDTSFFQDIAKARNLAQTVLQEEDVTVGSLVNDDVLQNLHVLDFLLLEPSDMYVKQVELMNTASSFLSDPGTTSWVQSNMVCVSSSVTGSLDGGDTGHCGFEFFGDDAMSYDEEENDMMIFV